MPDKVTVPLAASGVKRSTPSCVSTPPGTARRPTFIWADTPGELERPRTETPMSRTSLRNAGLTVSSRKCTAAFSSVKAATLNRGPTDDVADGGALGPCGSGGRGRAAAVLADVVPDGGFRSE